MSATLQATAVTDDGDGVTGTYSWRRCTGRSTGSCAAIPGAAGPTYAPTTGDVGRLLRARLTMRGDDDDDDSDHDDDDEMTVVDSAPTAPVAAAPTLLGPAVSQVPATVGTPKRPTTLLPKPTARRRLRRMRPAPTVRIAGRVTRRGASVTVLSVRAPRGVTIAVRCTGDGCPRRALALTTRVTRLRAFERHLLAGTRLAIRITRAGFRGMETVLRIRRGKPPTRIDRPLR